MPRFASALPILALLATAPLAAPVHAQAARDFQLPPAPTPAADNRVQGPVDTDAVVPVRPRAIETARAGEQTPAPTPTAQPTRAPAPTLPAPASARQTAPQQRPGAATPTGTGANATTAATPPTPAPLPSAPVVGTGTPVAGPAPPILAPSSAPSVPPPAAASPSPTSWWPFALVGLVMLLGAGVFLWRRRSAEVVVPVIAAPPTPAAAPGEALAMRVEAVRMDRSVLNATVGYRVTLRNRTAQALDGVIVEADLVSASQDRPAEQQLASPDLALVPRHTVGRLAPGQSLRIEGQVRLPLAEASAIWQGRVGLLVPLLRVRATASTGAPVASTLVIGRAEGSTARPQPFRLDEPPRSYAPLAQRVLDAVPARA